MEEGHERRRHAKAHEEGPVRLGKAQALLQRPPTNRPHLLEAKEAIDKAHDKERQEVADPWQVLEQEAWNGIVDDQHGPYSILTPPYMLGWWAQRLDMMSCEGCLRYTDTPCRRNKVAGSHHGIEPKYMVR